MGNMAHCKFENTLPDLRDCYDNFDDISELSEEEKRARTRMIKLCIEIALDYAHEVNRTIKEI